jgi:hypothetical protein
VSDDDLALRIARLEDRVRCLEVLERDRELVEKEQHDERPA